MGITINTAEIDEAVGRGHGRGQSFTSRAGLDVRPDARPQDDSSPGDSSLITCPFEIAIDTREQAPFPFRSIPVSPSVVRVPAAVARAASDSSPPTYLVQTQRITLATGDYSIVGRTREITIERKSKADLYQTLTRDRDRFVRELDRMTTFQFACVIVEASWRELWTDPPVECGKVQPQSITGSILAWQQRYPRIHWLLADDRRTAEVLAFRVLERWWRENIQIVEAAAKRAARNSIIKGEVVR